MLIHIAVQVEDSEIESRTDTVLTKEPVADITQSAEAKPATEDCFQIMKNNHKEINNEYVLSPVTQQTDQSKSSNFGYSYNSTEIFVYFQLAF